MHADLPHTARPSLMPTPQDAFARLRPLSASGHTREQPRSSSASRFTIRVLVAMVRLVSCCTRCLRQAGVEVVRDPQGDRGRQGGAGGGQETGGQETWRGGEGRGETSRKQEAKKDEETGGMAEGREDGERQQAHTREGGAEAEEGKERTR